MKTRLVYPRPTFSSFLFLILLSSLSLSSWLGITTTTTPIVVEAAEGDKERIEVLMWSGGSWAGFGRPVYKVPNYLGHEVVKEECPVDCVISFDKNRQGVVDGIIFEGQPLTSYGDEYLMKPVDFPQKRPGQAYINYGYEQSWYFPIYAEPGYLTHIDVNMTFDFTGDVPITFTCNWGGGTMSDFLKPPRPKDPNKLIAFMTTNCGGLSGSGFRTEFVKELMKHIDVHSYGGCLHNTELPKEYQVHHYADVGASMRMKIDVFKDYMFVLALENNNVTDYVTEKLPCAYQSGSIPIYMGAPNVDEWVPGEKSLIKTDDFKDPKDLAEYLKYLIAHPDEYDKYFEWKKKGLSEKFVDKYNKCVFYNAECRLCEHLADRRRKMRASGALVNGMDAFGESEAQLNAGYAIAFRGAVSIVVPNSPELSKLFVDEFTIACWVWFEDTNQGMRIVDKNTAGVIDGVLFDLQPRVHGSSQQRYNYLRLCIAWRCFMGTRPIHPREWLYVAVSFQKGQEGVTFSINGLVDVTYPFFESGVANSLPLTFGMPASHQTEALLGFMDDISIWSRVVSPDQLRDNSFRRLAGNEPGLEGYWPCNEGEGEAVHDVSTKKRHATLKNTGAEGNLWHQSQMKPLALAGCW